MRKSSILVIPALLLLSACLAPPPVQQSEEAQAALTAKLGQPRLWARWSLDQPVQTYRAAILYFKLADDAFDASAPAYSDSLRCLVRQWPVQAPQPKWKGEMLITRPFAPATARSLLPAKPYSLTAFFYQMSGGRYWLYGHEYTYAGPAITRAKTKKQWRENNRKILQWFIDHHNLRALDNDGDGVVDLIMLVNRARPKFPYGNKKRGTYQGVADGDYLPANTVIADRNDAGEPVIRASRSVRKNSGTYQTDCYALTSRNIILHELGHRLIGAGHKNALHRWNLMSGAGRNAPTSSGVVLSAYEKMRLGWLQPIVLAHDTTDFALADLTATNQAAQIPVRGGYFLLEYRRNHPYFEIIPEPTCPDSRGLGEGLLVSFVPAGGQPRLLAADNSVAKIGTRGAPKMDGDASDLFPQPGATEITPYTVPNTNTHRKRRSGVAIKNIRREENVLRFDVYLNYFEGRLEKNSTWRGRVTVGRTLTIPAGRRLTVQPGTRVTFLPGAALVVDGTLLARGKENDEIHFTAAKGKTWSGLVINAASGSSSKIDHLVLQKAENKIKIKGAKPRIRHVRIVP